MANDNVTSLLKKDEKTCYGALRDGNPSFMLSVTTETGKRQAFPYHLLSDVIYDIDTGSVIIVYPQAKVTLKGRNLVKLYDRIVQHLLAWVKVMNDIFKEKDVWVESIEIETKKSG